MAFSGSPILFYDVPKGGIWGKLGFAVPNWGTRQVTRNSAILDFVSVVGRNLQSIMLTDDALSTRPPNINRIIDINKLLMAVRAMLGNEGLPDNQPALEGVKATQDVESFLLYPCPYFMVRNRWLKRYAQLCFHALAEAIQSTENDTSSFEISNEFCKQMNGYFNRIMQLLATDLLRISPAVAANNVPMTPYGFPDWGSFVLTDAQIMAYTRSWFTSTEKIDTCFPTGDVPSDFDLTLLTTGIPIEDMPVLTAYPNTPVDSVADTSPDPSSLVSGNLNSNPPATGTAAATLAETQAVGQITGAPITSPNAPAAGAPAAAAAPAATAATGAISGAPTK